AALSVVAGVAAASLTPGRALDLGKPLLFQQSYGGSLGEAMVAALAERLLDLLTLVAVFAGVAVLVPQGGFGRSLGLWLVGGTVVLATALMFLWPRAVVGAIRGLAAATPSGSRGRARLERAAETVAGGLRAVAKGGPALVGLSVAALGLEVGRAWLVFHAVHLPVDLPVASFAFLGSVFLGLAALVPGGVGVTELSEVGILRLLGVGGPSGPPQAAVLLDRLLSYYSLVLAGAVVLLAWREPHPLPPSEDRQRAGAE
ncbi:MAG TPA: flippase-like domain-containing protein, partial [Firmicutes bacterium]|nr:flippase-like domain-containing protein [Bacillota bacterium]